MSIPVWPYRKWKRVFDRGGARFVRKDGKNHYIWAYTPSGETNQVTAALVAHNEGDDVNPVYIRVARRNWRLRKEDGVSDDNFLKGRWS